PESSKGVASQCSRHAPRDDRSARGACGLHSTPFASMLRACHPPGFLAAQAGRLCHPSNPRLGSLLHFTKTATSMIPGLSQHFLKSAPRAVDLIGRTPKVFAQGALRSGAAGREEGLRMAPGLWTLASLLVAAGAAPTDYWATKDRSL